MTRCKRPRVLFAVCLVGVLRALPVQAQTVVYVDANATGPTHDGTSWCYAYLTLHEALSAVSSATIKVANGTYYPGASGNRDAREATFQLKDGVALEGGYAGCGADNPNYRNVALLETILSGDLDQDDGPDFTNTDDNAYHVVTGSGTDETAVLDGFTITAGSATGVPPHNVGGGMLNEAGNPTVVRCTFAANQATKGGGMHNADGSGPQVISCMFQGNDAYGGGGIYNLDSSPTLVNGLFTGNTACTGGGIANVDTDPEVGSSPSLVNCTFSGNSADSDEGGGMWSLDSDPTVDNSIFWSNGDGGEIIDASGAATTVTYSDVQGGWAGAGNHNINVDPLLGGDFNLGSGSPCIDAADNTAVPAGVITDLDGGDRFVDDPVVEDTGEGEQPIVDMGAYERQCPSATTPEPERLALPNNPISQKIRYLSFTAGDTGRTQSVRVTLKNVPAPYAAWEGIEFWVQQPARYCEHAGTGTAPQPGNPPNYGCPGAGGLVPLWFWGATLGCAPPDPIDWSSYGVVHVFHEGIIPTKHLPLPVDYAEYDIQVIDSTCSPEIEANYSAPLTMTQSRWGDLISDCSTNPCGPPNNDTAMADVTAVLDKWKNLPGNVQKARADVEGAPSGDARIPNQKVDITDVTVVLNAFLYGYTYPPPGYPPPTSPPPCQ